MSEKHFDKNEARKRLKKYTKEEIAKSLYEAMVEGIEFEYQTRARNNSDFVEDMYRIAEGAYNIRGTKLGKRSQNNRENIKNRYKDGKYINVYNGHRQRIEGKVTYKDILWVVMKYPQGLPEENLQSGKMQSEDVPDYKPFEEIMWEHQNDFDVSPEAAVSEKKNLSGLNPPKRGLGVILAVALLIFITI